MRSWFVGKSRGLRGFPGWAWALLVVANVWVGTSQAQDADPAEYSAAVKQALEELDANNLPEALAEFRRAHEIFPNARSLRGIGMVEFDLRDYANSVHHLEEALASRIKPLAGKMRADAEALHARALRYLGEIRIMTEPANATVLVDGSPTQPRSDGLLWLNPGDHVIEVRARGYAAETRTLPVTGGDQRQLVISLRVVDPAHSADQVASPSTPVPSSPPQSERQPAYRKWWVWTLVVVAVAGGATTAALLLSRHDGPSVRPVEGTNTTGATLHALRLF